MDFSKTEQDFPVAFDLASHHALGGGSYAFKDNYPRFIKTLPPFPKSRTEINIIIQPNSSPHVGTLCSLGLTFVLARRMKDTGLDISVVCDLWDRAKGEQMTINGAIYQSSLHDTGKFQTYLPDYEEVLSNLSQRYEVSYRLRLEEEFLSSPGMGNVIQKVIQNRAEYGKVLAPGTQPLAIRAACPHCGLVDKYGQNNIFAADGSAVSFECPVHGRYTYTTEADASKFQFNCQLFNLVLGLFHENVPYNYIEICGSDYAGFWQERLLWRFLQKPILIVYTPLIADWSGSKESKSLYLNDTAYDYLKRAGQEYLLSYRALRRDGKDLDVLWDEVELWVDEPFRLFRGYSLHYIHLLFEQKQLLLGVIHEKKVADSSNTAIIESSRGRHH